MVGCRTAGFEITEDCASYFLKMLSEDQVSQGGQEDQEKQVNRDSLARAEGKVDREDQALVPVGHQRRHTIFSGSLKASHIEHYQEFA